MNLEEVLDLIEKKKREGYKAGFIQGVRKREVFENVAPQDLKQFIKDLEKRIRKPVSFRNNYEESCRDLV